MPKELFNEIVKDEEIKSKMNMKEEMYNSLSIDTKVENDFISVLKIILYSQNDKQPSQTVYKSIKKHFKIQ